MYRMTMKHNVERILVGAAACITALVTTASPLVAQEVIELPAEDRILSADFEELYRVGSLLGDEWDTFGQIADVDFDAAGNLHVLDGQAAKITVVDREGNLVRQFGRVGEGPGEFSGVRDVWALTACSDQSVAVYDAGRRVFRSFWFRRRVRTGNPAGRPQICRDSGAAVRGRVAVRGVDRRGSSIGRHLPNRHSGTSCATG